MTSFSDTDMKNIGRDLLLISGYLNLLIPVSTRPEDSFHVPTDGSKMAPYCTHRQEIPESAAGPPLGQNLRGKSVLLEEYSGQLSEGS